MPTSISSPDLLNDLGFSLKVHLSSLSGRWCLSSPALFQIECSWRTKSRVYSKGQMGHWGALLPPKSVIKPLFFDCQLSTRWMVVMSMDTHNQPKKRMFLDDFHWVCPGTGSRTTFPAEFPHEVINDGPVGRTWLLRVDIVAPIRSHQSFFQASGNSVLRKRSIKVKAHTQTTWPSRCWIT